MFPYIIYLIYNYPYTKRNSELVFICEIYTVFPLLIKNGGSAECFASLKTMSLRRKWQSRWISNFLRKVVRYRVASQFKIFVGNGTMYNGQYTLIYINLFWGQFGEWKKFWTAQKEFSHFDYEACHSNFLHYRSWSFHLWFAGSDFGNLILNNFRAF